MSRTRKELLEELIDVHYNKNGDPLTAINHLQNDLTEICLLKAQHANEAWQDDVLAHQWECAAVLPANIS